VIALAVRFLLNSRGIQRQDQDVLVLQKKLHNIPGEGRAVVASSTTVPTPKNGAGFLQS